jgi:hypothetical protein
MDSKRKLRPRPFSPTGEHVTLDDLRELVAEMEALGMPGESVIRARSAIEINLQHGARLVGMTVMPPE